MSVFYYIAIQFVEICQRNLYTLRPAFLVHWKAINVKLIHALVANADEEQLLVLHLLCAGTIC